MSIKPSHMECQILLQDKEKEGIVTSEKACAYLYTPGEDQSNTEQIHLSGSSDLLNFISDSYDKNNDIKIFAIFNNQKIELTINNMGLIIPKT